MANDLESQVGEVVSVSRSATHTFSKRAVQAIMLLAGLGVEGDAHMGQTVKHRSRVAQDPNQPNLRFETNDRDLNLYLLDYSLNIPYTKLHTSTY